MINIFNKKLAAFTILTVILVSLFSWGIIAGEDDDESTTTVTVVERFEISVNPANIVFDALNEDGSGDYGDVGRGDEDIYASYDTEDRLTVEVLADVTYRVDLTISDMYHEDDWTPGNPFPGDPNEEVIPQDSIHYSLHDGTSWPAFASGVNGEVVVEDNGDDTEGLDVEYELRFMLDQIPTDVTPGEHNGTLTFDLSSI